MIIKQRKCSSCSFTFAIPEEVAEAVCPSCGELVSDPELQETSSASPGPLIPELPDPLPASPADPEPGNADPPPTFSPPEETPTTAAKPALGRIALKKKALPKVAPGAKQKSAKKSRYDDSAIRGQGAEISTGSPPARQNAISIKEVLPGAESPPLTPPGEVDLQDDEDFDYVAMECEPLKVGDLVVMDGGGEPALPRITTPPPPMPVAPTLPPPTTDDHDWQPLPVDFQPPPLAEESEPASNYDFDLQPSSAVEELAQPEPYTALQPLSLDQTEPSGYEEGFHQAAAGESPADSLTPLPVFESATDTVKKPVAAGPGIKVVVPLMPVEEVQLGGKRPEPATPAPEPARMSSERTATLLPSRDGAIATPAKKMREPQGRGDPKEAPWKQNTPESKDKTKKKRKKWWLFGLLGKSLSTLGPVLFSSLPFPSFFPII